MPAMASYTQYKDAFRKIGAWKFVKTVITQIGEDGLTTWAAALAYTWIFAIFPFLIFLLSLIAFIPGNKDARVHQMEKMLAQSMPNTTAGKEAQEAKEGAKPPESSKNMIVAEIPRLMKTQSSGLLSIGLILALWSASAGMSTTMSALNRCYDITVDRPFYIQRPIAILVTLIVMVLIIIVMILLPLIGAAMKYVEYHPDKIPMIGKYLTWPIIMTVHVIRSLISAALLFLAVSVIYYFGPKLKSGYRYISPGSIFTVVTWLLLGLVFKIYVDKFGASSYARTYGAVGGAIILLLSFYLDALVLLIGAEINSEFDFVIYGKTGGTAKKGDENAAPAASPSVGGTTTPHAAAAAATTPATPPSAPAQPSPQRSAEPANR
jgi:membrane protein